MKQFLYFLSASFFLLVTACSNGSDTSKLADLQMQIDSLLAEKIEKDSSMNQLNMFLSVMAESIDSICLNQSNLLTMPREGMPPKESKERLKQNLQRLKEIVDVQWNRIEELENMLATQYPQDTVTTKRLQTIINFYKQQLLDKDQMIASLQDQLKSTRVNLRNLQVNLDSLTANNASLTTQVEEQLRIMDAQNDIINEGYVRIGTKKELKEMGLLTGNILQKKRLDVSKFSTESFQRVDISQYNDIVIEDSKNPKILTQMPPSSYKFNNNGNGTVTLHISDPAIFWSISNYLVIQK